MTCRTSEKRSLCGAPARSVAELDDLAMATFCFICLCRRSFIILESLIRNRLPIIAFPRQLFLAVAFHDLDKRFHVARGNGAPVTHQVILLLEGYPVATCILSFTKRMIQTHKVPKFAHHRDLREIDLAEVVRRGRLFGIDQNWCRPDPASCIAQLPVSG